jgi:hypothetical protein
MPITVDECIAALLEATEQLGHSPSKAEYESLALRPSSGTIRRVVGGWNQAKELADLETYSAGDNYNNPIQPKPESLALPEGFEWDELTAQQRWYYKNRKHRIAVKEERRIELKEWFYEFKRDHCQCEKCGEDHPATIDFHHEGNKQDEVSRMVNHGYSRTKIESEIDRCVILCANCHQIEHYDLPGWWDDVTLEIAKNERSRSKDKHLEAYPKKQNSRFKEEHRGKLRSWLYIYKGLTEGCNRCNQNNPACLEYHHLDQSEKKNGISQLINRQPSLNRLLKEMEKRELVCRNCHRKEHYEPPNRLSRTQD